MYFAYFIYACRSTTSHLFSKKMVTTICCCFVAGSPSSSVSCYDSNTRGDLFGNCQIHRTDPVTYTACSSA